MKYFFTTMLFLFTHFDKINISICKLIQYFRKIFDNDFKYVLIYFILTEIYLCYSKIILTNKLINFFVYIILDIVQIKFKMIIIIIINII